MTQNDESAPATVLSRDGTEIAYWTSGHGPPLVLVHGTAADHTRWQPLLPYLEPHATLHVVDRRGRGASGDSQEYALAREFEDIAALVDAIAEVFGVGVDVYGHSHGGFCAFGAAALTSNVRRLVLYEGWPLQNPEAYALPEELSERLDLLLEKGEREAVVETVFRELLQMSDAEIEVFRAAPSWPGRVQAAHTIGRELRAESQARLSLEQASGITATVMLLVGSESSDPARTGVADVSAALLNAPIVVIEGQEHTADVVAPEVVAQHLLTFLRVRD